MVGDRSMRDWGGAGGWLALAACIGLLLAAAAILSVVALVWTSYLSGRSIGPLSRGEAPAAWPPVPEGAVIAVQGDTCPRPWQTYLPAQGRFILGAGVGGVLNLDANGVLTPVRKAGETGGRAGVELTVSDLPPHTHRFVIGRSIANWVGPHPQAIQKSPPVKIVVGMPVACPRLVARVGF